MWWTEATHLGMIDEYIVHKTPDVLAFIEFTGPERSQLSKAYMLMNTLSPEDRPFIKLLKSSEETLVLHSKHSRHMIAAARAIASLETNSTTRITVTNSQEYAAFSDKVVEYITKKREMGPLNAAQSMRSEINSLTYKELTRIVALDLNIPREDKEEEHIKVLEKAFQKLYEAKLRPNPEKCHFFRNKLKYLGHVVDKDGLHTDPEKVSAILNLTPPRNLKEARCFLGLISWYRRFIMDRTNDLEAMEEEFSRLRRGQAASSPRVPIGEGYPGAVEEMGSLPTSSKILDQMRKWNCHFDGKNVYAFLERLQELQKTYQFSDQQILRGFPELLRGDAQLWYRNCVTYLF